VSGDVVVDGVFPWPASVLSPNSSSHWAKKAAAKKLHRGEACRLCTPLMEVGKHHRMNLEIWLEPPTRRAYDTDNLLARLKSTLDGIFDGLPEDVDDRQIEDILIHRCPPFPKKGRVRIVLRAV
jgi:crossover junction endodeoxyribonuclease RusA